MLRPARQLVHLGLLVPLLSGCDETAQPRPQAGRDAAVDAGGAGGSAGSAGAGTGGGSAGAGSGGGPPCEAAAPPVTPATLPDAPLGAAYAQQLSIVGATAVQVSWAVQGALPPGLTLTEDAMQYGGPPQEARADLAGTPTAAGTYAFEVVVALIAPVTCASPPARRMYELLVTDPDADAGR